MGKKMGNYIYVPRSIFFDESLDDGRYSRREAFLDLVQRASYEPEKVIIVKGGRVVIKRGQLAFSLRKLAEKWGWGKDKVAKTLEDFQAERRIDILKDSLTSVLSIVNYDTFQGCADTNQDTSADTIADTDKDADKDNNKNNKEDKKTRNKEKRVVYPDAVERIYALYPGKTTRPEGGDVALKSASRDKDKIKKMLESGAFTEDSLSYAIKRYTEEAKPEYLLLFQTFLNKVPDYGEADSQTSSTPQVAPAPSSREEAMEWATNPTKEEVNRKYKDFFLPQYPPAEGETQEEYRERVRPAWDRFYKAWIDRRVLQVNNKY